jgi:hypothetical protein
MLHYWINQTVHVFRYTKNDLVFLYSFNPVKWYNILGELSYIVKAFSKFRKELGLL